MATDYWIDMTYYLFGRQRAKRMTTPFRTRIAAENYIHKYLDHRKEIGLVQVVGEESGFFDHIDRNTIRSDIAHER